MIFKGNNLETTNSCKQNKIDFEGDKIENLNKKDEDELELPSKPKLSPTSKIRYDTKYFSHEKICLL